jgi:type IV secretory pathway VirB10-like protein
MTSKPVAVGLLAIACVTAAAGGAFMAVRQNHAAQTAQMAASQATPEKAEQAVAETEAVVSPPPALEVVKPASAVSRPSAGTERPAAVRKETPPASATPVAKKASPRTASTASQESAPAIERPSAARDAEPPPVSAVPSTASSEASTPEAPVVPARPTFVEVVVPASSVVGLHVTTSITSETASVEDRVEARVTRDVMADGRVAIPAGTRVIGDVTLVERGGKMKDKARLGVRFHTLVLADNSQVPFRTDAIFREGSSPGNEASRKIGGAAIGGAILGAIIGGAKGAAIGGATGAGGGAAVVMAGDRNAATLPAGTIVTVRLSSPVAVDVEREQ